MPRLLTNKEFSEQSQEFIDACRAANLSPTPRMASKFRNRHGRVWDTWKALLTRSTESAQE